MSWRRDTVLVGSIGVDGASTGDVTRYLRDAGQTVIVADDYPTADTGVPELVQTAAEEDVAAIDVTVSPRNELAVDAQLRQGFADHDMDGILTDLHYRMEDPDRDDWMQIEAVGRTNGQLLADSGYTPDDATVRDIWEALQEGYAARLNDAEEGEQVGRAQAKRIYMANRDRYGHPPPLSGRQSRLSWWTEQYGNDTSC